MERDRKKKRGRRISYVGWGLLVVGCIIALFILLLLIDSHHREIDRLINRHLNFDNYFKGEIWFSVLATCFAAIPGMICGFIALIQTKRIHELEDRYHRPGLRLRNAWMKVYWIRSSSYSNGVPDSGRERQFVRRMLEDAEYNGNFLMLSLELESKNEIEVETIEIDSITFFMAGVTYPLELKPLEPDWLLKQNCEFSRKFENEKYLYCVECVVYPFTLKNPGVTQEMFWDAIEKYTNYDNRLEDEYETIELRMDTKVYYEYAAHGFEKVVGRIFWNCHQGAGRHGAVAEGQSNNGYFRFYE